MTISDRAFDLIVAEEVTNRTNYESRFRHPVVPGLQSGVTIGIGYDLGHTARETIEGDWRGRVSDATLEAMLSAQGVKGASAKSLVKSLRPRIDIPWDTAIAVHRQRVLPRWEATVAKALPNTDKLSADCFGALVSLTFNRGPSFNRIGERFREMNAIKDHMEKERFDLIPNEIRSMKRIWKGTKFRGLLRRRDAEADLFESGLEEFVPPPTGEELLRRAEQHIGEEFHIGPVPKDDPNWRGPWDCAEFVSWLVYQETGKLYGCANNNGDPSRVEAFTGAWQRDAERIGKRVPVDEAANTAGAIVLRYPPPGQRAMGHVAVSDGNGGTVEAKGRKEGVTKDNIEGRRWDTGVLIPGISYESSGGTGSFIPPTTSYYVHAPNMDSAVIVNIKKALLAKGFDPGDIDGEYRQATAIAVAAFQDSRGLNPDGEVGEKTAAELGISLTKPSEPSGPSGTDKGTGTTKTPPGPFGPIMPLPGGFPPIPIGAFNPFVVIAARIFPEIVKAVEGDKTGRVTGTLTKVIAEVTQALTPEEARDKLNADPEAVARLQLELAKIASDQAEIAADQAEKQRQAQLTAQKLELAELKIRLEDSARSRDAGLEQAELEAGDTKDARASMRAIAAMAGADKLIRRTPPILSFLVTIGFFAVLGTILIWGLTPAVDGQAGKDAEQVIYIVIGALTASLATVLNFWLGSSQGSRVKDVMTKTTQQEAVELRAEAFRTMAGGALTANPVKSAKRAKPAGHIQQCLDIVLNQEAAADHPGQTKFGITFEKFSTFRPNDIAELNALTREKAGEFYRMYYWNGLRCNDLPMGVDLIVLDTAAAEDSPGASAKMLQDAVGAKDDGWVGPVTMGAIEIAAPRDIVTNIATRRRKEKSPQPEDRNRVDEVENMALRMIDTAA